MIRIFARKPGSVGGFTLLELLVSLSLFSLLILTVAYTLRMAGTLLQKAEQRYAGDTPLLSRLRDSLAGSYAYVGERGALASRGKDYFNYFSGNILEIAYISSRPINGKGLTLTRLRYRNHSLLLDEAALYSLQHDFKEPVMPVDDISSMVLMTNLESFRIEYLNDGQWSPAIEETLPAAVRFWYKKPNTPEIRELYVRIKNNFSDKKEFMEVISASPGGP